jgi:hypothetical protein
MFKANWLRLPSGIALLLGLGALAPGSARADFPDQGSRTAVGDVLVRSEHGKIYLSEGGRETELKLTATPQRDRLLRLLEEHGPAGIKLHADPRLIMSSGGGAGFSLWDIKKSLNGKPAPAPQGPSQVAAPPKMPEQRSVPRDLNPAADKKG